MIFVHSNFIIWVLLAVLAAAGFYIWSFRARRRALERFAQKELLPELLTAVDRGKQKLKAVLVLAAIFLTLIALLQPQWGFKWQQAHRRGVSILIALDTSKSMLTPDILPSRLDRAKLALRDLVGRLRGDRIGLIAFAGTAFLECPLTVDYDGFLLSLENVDTAAIPLGGTSLSAAIKEAQTAFKGLDKKYCLLVIITDGEDHVGDALRAAQDAKNEGIIIYCIGVGTKEGELIALSVDGKKEYLKDKEGNVVKSRLNETLLEQIALQTGGSYIRANPIQFGLDILYQERILKMAKQEFQAKLNKRYTQRFQIPLLLAVVCLLIEACISERR